MEWGWGYSCITRHLEGKKHVTVDNFSWLFF